MIRFNCPNCERPYEIPDALARLPLVCKHCGQRITVPEPAPEPPPPAPTPKPKPQPAVLPSPVTAPPPPPPPQPAPQPKLPPPAPPPPPPVEPAKPHAVPFHDDEPTGDDVLVTKADSTPDIDFNVGGPTAASLSDAARARPSGLSDANRPKPHPEATEPDLDLEVLAKAPRKPAPVPAPTPAPGPEEEKPEPSLLPLVTDLVTFVVLVVAGMLLGEFLVQKPTGTVLSEAGSAAVFPPTDLLLWGSPPATFALTYVLLYGRERSLGAWLRRKQRPA